MQGKHGDKILTLLLVIWTSNKMGKIKKYFLGCSTFQAHIIYQLLCTGDSTMKMNSASPRFSLPMLIVLALSTSVPEKILFFVVPGERKREAHAQATVSWVADASKHSTSNMQDLHWGFAKSKPAFSPSLLLLKAF